MFSASVDKGNAFGQVIGTVSINTQTESCKKILVLGSGLQTFVEVEASDGTVSRSTPMVDAIGRTFQIYFCEKAFSLPEARLHQLVTDGGYVWVVVVEAAERFEIVEAVPSIPQSPRLQFGLRCFPRCQQYHYDMDSTLPSVVTVQLEQESPILRWVLSPDHIVAPNVLVLRTPQNTKWAPLLLSFFRNIPSLVMPEAKRSTKSVLHISRDESASVIAYEFNPIDSFASVVAQVLGTASSEHFLFVNGMGLPPILSIADFRKEHLASTVKIVRPDAVVSVAWMKASFLGYVRPFISNLKLIPSHVATTPSVATQVGRGMLYGVSIAWVSVQRPDLAALQASCLEELLQSGADAHLAPVLGYLVTTETSIVHQVDSDFVPLSAFLHTRPLEQNSKLIFSLALQILKGLDSLRCACRFPNGPLSLERILVRPSDDYVRLIGFGVAVARASEFKCPDIGTHTFDSDMWYFGAVLFYFKTGVMVPKVFEQVPGVASDRLLELATACLRKDPNTRPSTKQALAFLLSETPLPSPIPVVEVTPFGTWDHSDSGLTLDPLVERLAPNPDRVALARALGSGDSLHVSHFLDPQLGTRFGIQTLEKGSCRTLASNATNEYVALAPSWPVALCSSPACAIFSEANSKGSATRVAIVDMTHLTLVHAFRYSNAFLTALACNSSILAIIERIGAPGSGTFTLLIWSLLRDSRFPDNIKRDHFGFKVSLETGKRGVFGISNPLEQDTENVAIAFAPLENPRSILYVTSQDWWNHQRVSTNFNAEVACLDMITQGKHTHIVAMSMGARTLRWFVRENDNWAERSCTITGDVRGTHEPKSLRLYVHTTFPRVSQVVYCTSTSLHLLILAANGGDALENRTDPLVLKGHAVFHYSDLNKWLPRTSSVHSGIEWTCAVLSPPMYTGASLRSIVAFTSCGVALQCWLPPPPVEPPSGWLTGLSNLITAPAPSWQLLPVPIRVLCSKDFVAKNMPRAWEKALRHAGWDWILSFTPVANRADFRASIRPSTLTSSFFWAISRVDADLVNVQFVAADETIDMRQSDYPQNDMSFDLWIAWQKPIK